MDPTSLPTDNLYKFWALGSLLAMGSVLYFARKRSQELHAQKAALELEIKKHRLRNEHLKADIKAGLAADTDRQRQAEIADTQIEHQVKTLSKLIDDGSSSSNWSLLGLVLCLASAVVGFWFWYVKAQQFQDQATLYGLREQKAKAELVEIELATAKAKLDSARSVAKP